MADEEENEEIEDAGEKPSKIVPILIVVNILVSAGALFKITGIPTEPVIVNTVAPEIDREEQAAPDEQGPIHAFEPFLVNLNEPGGGRFLRATVEVEVRNDEDLAELQAMERKVRDEVLRFLSNLRVDATLGEANRLKIQAGIVERIATLLGSDKIVKNIYFPDFVVQ